MTKKHAYLTLKPLAMFRSSTIKFIVWCSNLVLPTPAVQHLLDIHGYQISMAALYGQRIIEPGQKEVKPHKNNVINRKRLIHC